MARLRKATVKVVTNARIVGMLRELTETGFYGDSIEKTAEIAICRFLERQVSEGGDLKCPACGRKDRISR